MEFNRDYVLSLMPNKLSKEEQIINKQWDKIQKEIIRRAKNNYHTYYCYYWDYDDKILELLKINNFKVYIDYFSGHLEIEW